MVFLLIIMGRLSIPLREARRALATAAALTLAGTSYTACDHLPTSPWPAARDDRTQATAFPEWAFRMRLAPFDVLEPGASDESIDARLADAAEEGATAVIVYIESEHMYGTFVDEAGFTGMLDRVAHLTASAAALDLRTLVYVNGLEVMTRGAYDGACQPTGVATMANEHPDWLQLDLSGEPIVYGCVDEAWLEPDWEDAWISPYSGYRDLFKERIGRLAAAGADGIYIDATFLPGFQLDEDDLRWGSADAAFAAAFEEATGLGLPAEEDLASDTFQAFLAFRHQAVADYLGDLGETAWSAGLVPFWESSSNDTPEGTALGNETAVTGRLGLGFSPEVEAEGDWPAAFRMAKAARELNQERPQIYLSWPEEEEEAALEFATAVAHSGTFYPTADAPWPDDGPDLLDAIAGVLDWRVPYAGDVTLVYSWRNKDRTYDGEATFEAYVDAFEELTSRHVPLRIAALEDLPSDGLEGRSVAVLAGIEGLSDDEVAALSGATVVPVGEDIGTRGDDWSPREAPVAFGDAIDLDDVEPWLPFGLEAPEGTLIEFYGDRDGAHRMALFAVSPDPGGSMVLWGADGSDLEVRSWSLGGGTTDDVGEEVQVPVDAPLVVVVVMEA